MMNGSSYVLFIQGGRGSRGSRSWKSIIFCFWKSGVRSNRCLLPDQKYWSQPILSFITGQRQVPTCNLIAQANFKRIFSKIMIFKFQNLSSPTFLSNHPKTFRVCSRVNIKQIIRMRILSRPLNRNYSVSNFWSHKKSVRDRVHIF